MERLAIERALPPQERAVEDLFQAVARIGDRRQLDLMRQMFSRRLSKRQTPRCRTPSNFSRRNEDGVAIGASTPPWVERYGWIFEAPERGEPAGAISRSRSGALEMELHSPDDVDSGDNAADVRPESYLAGLNFIGPEAGSEADD